MFKEHNLPKSFLLGSLVFLILIICNSCSQSNSEGQNSNNLEESEESTDPEAETVEDEEVVEAEEQSVTEQLLSLVVKNQVNQVTEILENNQLDINEVLEVNGGPKWLVGSTLLTTAMIDCEYEMISFLLEKGANPNIPSVTYGYEEWDIGSIDGTVSIEDMEERGHDGYTIKESPLAKSLSCDDSNVFYSLLAAGANDITSILKGGVKWGDTTLLQKYISDTLMVDFVPGTESRQILNMLAPITDGKQYSEIGYGEGGDMFESDLMYACEDNNLALVRFMLETGADPNHCLPKNNVNGEFVEPDSAGYYLASTPLSIATDNFNSYMSTHSQREGDSLYLAKADISKAIIELLEMAGAEVVDKCLGP